MKTRILFVCFVLLLATASVWARAVNINEEKERTQKIERSIAADPAVTVSICMASGSINVRGWDKDEVKARSEAAEIELRRNDTPAAQAGRVRKLDVLVIDQATQQRGKDRCQAFSDLELNVPRTASVRVHTRDGNISIADVSMAFAGTQNGDVTIAKISHAVEVASVGGSISVRDSTGRTSITSIGGGIEAVNISPSASGDPFEAVSVTGDLMLDRISHSQLNAKTVTGNVHMTGPLVLRGRYEFKTMSGDVTLVLPVNASFNLSAKMAQDGEIVTDFPLTLTEESAPSTPSPAAAPSPKSKPAPPATAPPPTPAPKTPPTGTIVVQDGPRVKTIVFPVYTLRRYSAVCGDGGATIYVASFGGTLHLQKKN
jgi:DUF4097 and DUF4098 domain-containing protein YvlB